MRLGVVGALAWLLSSSACVKSSSVICGDEVCPEGTFCDTAHSGCVTQPQTTVCIGVADGERCTAGDLLGICDREYCIPGCGDTVPGEAEECDDGNHISHDGCSSACVLETLAWTAWEDPYRGLAGGIAGYHAFTGKIVSFGGFDEVQSRQSQWERDVKRNWLPRTPIALPPRDFAAMAYDPTRNVLVAFGGRAPDGTALGDTWEYNGQAWTQKTVVGPPARWGHAMTFEAVNNVVMLFGGHNTSQGFRDVWRYNGTSWTNIAAINITLPTDRWNHAMAYDPVAQRVVVAGGMPLLGLDSNKALLYNPATNAWTDIASVTPFRNRHSAALAYHPWRKKTVMFGGSTVNLGANDPAFVANDTWELDLSVVTSPTWTMAQTSVAPPGREFHTMTYVPYGTGGNPDEVLLLLGGRDATTFFDDVWEFTQHGQATPRWDRRRVDTSPAAGLYPIAPTATGELLSLAQWPGDPVIGYSQNAFYTRSSDTWLYDASRWTRAQAATRQRHDDYAIGYDPVRKKTVLHGGNYIGTYFTFEPRKTTWEWDGTAWTEFANATAPNALQRRAGTLTQAGPQGGMLLFGGVFDPGNLPTTLDDTWRWDGATWTQITTSPHPEAHERLPMAYDPNTERVIAFDKNGTTWTFASDTWTQLTPAMSPPARRDAAMTYVADLRGVVLYGGSNNTDLWLFDGTTWRELAIAGDGPTPRQTTSIAYHRSSRSTVLFGGSYANQTSAGDTWMLRFTSNTPDEDCANGTDDDGDVLIDATDPDCQ